MTTPQLTVKQLFDRESCTYTYLLRDFDMNDLHRVWQDLPDVHAVTGVAVSMTCLAPMVASE